MTDDPILDSTRTEENCPGRHLIGDMGFLRPYVDEMDRWVAMPVRLVISAGAGLCVEVGPYTFDRAEIEHLRTAIAAYERVAGRSHDGS